MQTKFIGAVEEIEGIHGQFYIAGCFCFIEKEKVGQFCI